MEEDEEKSDDSSNHYGSVEHDEWRKVINTVLSWYRRYLSEHEAADEYDLPYRRLQVLSKFRAKSLHLQLEREQEQYFERMESLHSEYKDVLTEPVVVDFLSAEQRICKLMRIVYDGIAEDIKLDLSYMDEV